MIAKYGPGFCIRDLIASGLGRREACSGLIRKLKESFGVRHAVLFESARSALECLLLAIGGGGSVVLPAYNCIAVPEAVARAGWQPVLADIAPGSVNMTRETLEPCITDGTRAVILTHQFGIPATVEPILELCRKRGLFVVEDAAASIGARYAGCLTGTFGDAAIISFGLTKVAPAGRAGALLTDDDEIAKGVDALHVKEAGLGRNTFDYAMAWAWWLAMQPRCYALLRRGHGFLRRDDLHQFVEPHSGPSQHEFHSCSDLVAELAGMQLFRLRSIVEIRQRLAHIYTEELAGCEGIGTCTIPDTAEPSWMQFPIFVENKERCYRYMLKKGIDLSWTFRYSCGESYGIRTVPNADRAAKCLLGLPTYPELSEDAAREICAHLLKAVSE